MTRDSHKCTLSSEDRSYEIHHERSLEFGTTVTQTVAVPNGTYGWTGDFWDAVGAGLAFEGDLRAKWGKFLEVLAGPEGYD